MPQISGSVTNLRHLKDNCLATSGTAESIWPQKRFRRSDVAGAVAEFHTVFDLPRRATPSIEIGDSLAKLRVALLEEECGEFISATEARDLVAIADALADVVYVAYGTAVTYGIDLDLVLSEVHRANMSKLDDNGKPIKRADGKVLKSERYTPPDVKAVLQLQSPLAFPPQI
jgi:predicted HAD superfamily Cof-like phosphohydrolase